MPRETSEFGLLGLVPGASQLALPLLGVHVEAEVHDFLCEVNIYQTYRNTHSSDIEAVYHFPLDEASAVCGFKAEYEDGVVVEAVVKEKSEAREEYTKAVRSGKQAQLLESVRPDIFTMTVGRMRSDSLITIKITYIALLKAEGSASRFLLPTHIAQRYSPANNRSPLVPVSASSGFKPMIGLDVRVKYNTQSPIKQITSPSHPSELRSSLIGDKAEAWLHNVVMDKDLIFLCEEHSAHQPRACVEVAQDGSLAGLVTIFPEIEFRDQAREIVFIIDRSGSMGFGRDQNGKTQMQSAKEALMLFLRALPPSCTFNIIGFGSSHASLFASSQPYNDATLSEATRYAQSMEANMGGTEILSPLQHALGLGHRRSGKRQVFVLTDGQVSNESQVFDFVRQACASGETRAFCLGIGQGVSHHLVEGIARAGKGTAAFVSGNDSDGLQVKVLSQLKQALQPSLDNVAVKWNFPAPSEPQYPPPSAPVKTLLGYRSPDLDRPRPCTVVPRAFPTTAPPVFNRERFVSFALFPSGHTQMPTSVTVTASTPDGPLEVELPITDEEILSGDIAHKLAARVAIREFEDSANGTGAVSKSEALAFALNNHLASSQTSFVAVRTEPMGELVTMPQAVDVQHQMEHRLERLRAQQQQQQSQLLSAVDCSLARGEKLDSLTLCADTVSWRACPEPAFSRSGLGSLFSGRSLSGFGSAFFGEKKKEAKRSKPDQQLSTARSGKHGSGSFLSGMFGSGDSLDACEDDSMAGAGSGGGGWGRAAVSVAASAPAPPSNFCKARASCPAPAKAFAGPQPNGGGPPKGGMFELCMLQRADGSFLLDAALSKILGTSLAELERTIRATLLSVSPNIQADSASCGTMAALLGLRMLFPDQRSVYELQEAKALSFLASKTADKAFAASQLDMAVVSVTASGGFRPSQDA